MQTLRSYIAAAKKDIHMEVDDLCHMMLYDVSNIINLTRRLQ